MCILFIKALLAALEVTAASKQPEVKSYLKYVKLVGCHVSLSSGGLKWLNETTEKNHDPLT